MADSENVTMMLRDLGRQLAALRRYQGLTQQQLSDLIDFSRPAVSLAEIGRTSLTSDFWQVCDEALDARGALVAGAKQIDSARDAELRAAARVAQESRETRALTAFLAAEQLSPVTTSATGVQACPHCGGDVAILTTLVRSENRPPVAEPA